MDSILTFPRSVFREDHEMLRTTVRRFLERECKPRQAQWDKDGKVDRETWLKAGREGLVRNLIYPVPDPQFPFLGVHFTRLIRGGIEAGPNAVLAFAREGYRFSQINPRDLAECLAFPGLWRFLWKHRRMCALEFAQSFSQERFCRTLQRLVPDLRMEDLETGGSGVRAQAMLPNGGLVEDFNFVRAENALHVLNAPSPAATSSLAIGEHIVAQL